MIKTTIKATNLKLTPAVIRAIKEKIATLDRFIPTVKMPIEAYVEVALETRHHKKGKIYYAEANIKILGELLRAEARDDSAYKAIGAVKDELKRLLIEHKKKQITKREKAQRALKERVVF